MVTYDTTSDSEDLESATDIATLCSLVSDLNSSDAHVRLRARQQLAAIGSPAVDPLVRLLSAPRWRLRWEAAKTLVEIADPAAAPALVRTLEDDRPGIRWLAAEALIAIGPESLPPLYHALLERPDSPWLRVGAHHVVRVLGRRGPTELKELTEPVHAALDTTNPAMELPEAVESALDIMRSRRVYRGATAAAALREEAALTKSDERTIRWRPTTPPEIPAPGEQAREITLSPIGMIHNRYRKKPQRPWEEIESEIVVNEDLEEALDGLEDFSHIQVLFWLHGAEAERGRHLRLHPQGREGLPELGVFATRSPFRPNPIGLTTVRLLERRRNVLRVLGLDALDGTPLLDLKPYLVQGDCWPEATAPEWIRKLWETK